MTGKTGLSTLTLFNAYERNRNLCETVRTARVSRYGILVDADGLARQYQKYDRRARKLSLVIRAKLGGGTYLLPRVCYRCGYTESGCTCKPLMTT